MVRRATQGPIAPAAQLGPARRVFNQSGKLISTVPQGVAVCDAPSYSNLMQQLMRASGMLVTGPQTSSALRGTQEVVCDLGQHLCCLCLPVLCSKTDGPGFESSSSPVVFIAYS